MRKRIAALLFAGLLGLGGVACEASGDIDTDDGVELDGDIDVDDNNDGDDWNE
jgi:hypothetical protein